MILQPLVENAIRHGVDGRSGPGTLEISARREGSRLRLAVRDDGPGLEHSNPRDPGRGIGLSNTRARLERLPPA